jgi:hypothetical protein
MLFAFSEIARASIGNLSAALSHLQYALRSDRPVRKETTDHIESAIKLVDAVGEALSIIALAKETEAQNAREAEERKEGTLSKSA